MRIFGEQGTASGSFRMPKGIGVDASGHVYVSDALAHRFVVFDLEGEYLLTVGGKQRYRKSVSPGGFYLPRGIDADDNDTVWVVDSLNRSLHRFQYLNEEFLEMHPVLQGISAMGICWLPLSYPYCLLHFMLTINHTKKTVPGK